jgi:hypothetical protein
VQELEGRCELQRPLADQALGDDLLLAPVVVVRQIQVLDWPTAMRKVGLQ